jgi:DNA-binding SARP family transcriptional activator
MAGQDLNEGEPTSGVAAEHARIARGVFDLTPLGLVVVDQNGRVLASNRAAGVLLGPSLASPARETVRCCDLFGCREPGGPLEHGCLTKIALDRGTELPEIRIDVASKGSLGAVWVTATPVDEGGTRRVLIHLRPGEKRDRRRRTNPHWMVGPRLNIAVLGHTRVASLEGAIGGAWLEQRPGQLLKYLVTQRGRVVPTEEIAEALWPKRDARVLGNVRHFIHVLRDRLEPDRPKRAPSSFIVARHGGYMIDPQHVRVDADEFEELVSNGQASVERGDEGAAWAQFESALNLYRGEFLTEERYAEWAFAERDRLREIAGNALSSLAKLKLEAGGLEGALDHYYRLAEMNPFDTGVQRELIALYLRCGRRTDAVRRYGALRLRMLREFGEPPDFELADLAENLARDKTA